MLQSAVGALVTFKKPRQVAEFDCRLNAMLSLGISAPLKGKEETDEENATRASVTPLML